MWFEVCGVGVRWGRRRTKAPRHPGWSWLRPGRCAMLVKTLLKRNGLTENEALLGLVGWLSVHLLSLYMYNCSVFFVFFSVILLFFCLGLLPIGIVVVALMRNVTQHLMVVFLFLISWMFWWINRWMYSLIGRWIDVSICSMPNNTAFDCSTVPLPTIAHLTYFVSKASYAFATNSYTQLWWVFKRKWRTHQLGNSSLSYRASTKPN